MRIITFALGALAALLLFFANFLLSAPFNARLVDLGLLMATVGGMVLMSALFALREDFRAGVEEIEQKS